jgi:hypothetical protein
MLIYAIANWMTQSPSISRRQIVWGVGSAHNKGHILEMLILLSFGYYGQKWADALLMALSVISPHARYK